MKTIVWIIMKCEISNQWCILQCFYLSSLPASTQVSRSSLYHNTKPPRQVSYHHLRGQLNIPHNLICPRCRKETVKGGFGIQVRTLSAPIPDLTTFITLMQTIPDTNPWGCTGYTQNGATIAGLTCTSQSYSGKVAYENAEAKPVGPISLKASTAAAFNTGVTTIMGPDALGTAMGGMLCYEIKTKREG